MSGIKDLTTYLSLDAVSSSAENGNPDLAVDAIVEYVGARRAKGMSFYEVMVLLIEVMQKVPPSLDPAFDLAREICHIPPLQDLTPSKTPYPYASRSASASTSLSRVIAVLSRCPEDISLEHARECVLEWSLALEGKIQGGSESKTSSAATAVGNKVGLGGGSGGSAGGAEAGWEGRGGKGTIGMAGFDEIESKFKDIIAALPNPDPQVLALLLSLRLMLSYLSLPELHLQLNELSLQDAESMLRQWVKRRLPGEGRFSLGTTLEMIEREAGNTRPALKAVIRIVKAKYLLPSEPLYRIPLPAPSKSKIISLLQGFIASGGPTSPTSPSFANNSPMSTLSGAGPTSPKSAAKQNPPGYFAAAAATNSAAAGTGPPTLPSKEAAVVAYAIELLSEWLTKEKRDSMRAEKWVKSGRKAISKDLNEIEDKLCFSGASSSTKSRKAKELSPALGADPSQNACLVPVFVLMRRLYNLDILGSSAGSVGSAGQPAIQVPDEGEPYYPPTGQSVTSSLYVFPRLSTEAAVAKLLELVDYEKDLRIQTALLTVHSRRASGADPMGRPSTDGSVEREDEENELRDVAWGVIEKTKMARVLENIARRFPEGEYVEAFKIVAQQTDCPPQQLHRAPSYKSVASATTAERTASYLKGATSHRGSASISLLGSNGRQMSPFTMANPGAANGHTPTPTMRMVSSPAPRPPMEAAPRTETPPARSASFSHGRSSSLPGQVLLQQHTTTTPTPSAATRPRLHSLDISSLNSDRPLTLDMPSNLIITTSPVQEEPGTETDLESIYAGYGELISPLTPSADGVPTGSSVAPFALEPPLSLTRTPASPPRANTDQPTRPAVPAVSAAGAAVTRSPTYPRNNPQSAGGGGGLTSSKSMGSPGSAFGTSSPRMAGVIMPRPAPGHSALSTPESARTPVRPGHTRQAPSLSPSSWRQEFMASNVLRRAPTTASASTRHGTGGGSR